MNKPSASGIWTGTKHEYIGLAACVALGLANILVATLWFSYWSGIANGAAISFYVVLWSEWRTRLRLQRLRNAINTMTDEGETR